MFALFLPVSLLLVAAIPPGRLDLYFWGYAAVNVLYAGRAFLPYAERAIEALEAGRTLMREHARGEAGQLTIGTAPAVGAYVLPGMLARYVERFPNVRLVVRTGHSEEIAEAVVARELDIGLIRELQHPGAAR